jgi:hypothetical protein
MRRENEATVLVHSGGNFSSSMSTIPISNSLNYSNQFMSNDFVVFYFARVDEITTWDSLRCEISLLPALQPISHCFSPSNFSLVRSETSEKNETTEKRKHVIR